MVTYGKNTTLTLVRVHLGLLLPHLALSRPSRLVPPEAVAVCPVSAPLSVLGLPLFFNFKAFACCHSFTHFAFLLLCFRCALVVELFVALIINQSVMIC